jgi:hypothetical protein
MSGDVFLTDDELETVLSTLDAPETAAVWSESFGLISGELRHFLGRGFGNYDACRLAILRGCGGSQAYIPKISTFLVAPRLIGSRVRLVGKPPARISPHQHHLSQAHGVLKARGRLTIADLKNEATKLNAQKTAVLAEIKRLTKEQAA